MHCPKCGEPIILVITDDNRDPMCDNCKFKAPVGWWESLRWIVDLQKTEGDKDD